MMLGSRYMLGAMSVVASGILVMATATDAHACGGFFCSQQTPVDQVSEKILFAVEGEEVTAHIQIQYQGDAEKFSWVLPLPAVPEFGVGTDELFNTLHRFTDPQFMVEWENPDDCQFDNACACRSEQFAGGDPSGDIDNDGGVDVLEEGSVGPFDYQVIASEDPMDLFNWLNDNGYDQPPTAQPLIQHYVNLEFVFVALRLQKDASVGEIQPIVLKYSAPSLACIPIKLTSISAQPGMPIFTWVLADSRAVPLNFFHLVLNPRAYDWLNCAQPSGGFGGCGWFGGNTDCQEAYSNMVTEATKRANGHGFVTEYAGTTEMLAQQIYQEGRYDLDTLRSTSDAAAYVQALLRQGFPRNGLMQQLIRAHIPKPDDALLPEGCKGERSFYATWNLTECLQYMPSSWIFDQNAFTDDVDERIVAPLRDAQAMLDNQPYMTRLFTTMDPANMTKDPLFSFNPDLPEVSNVHTVKARATCTPGSSTDVDYVTLTYPDGGRSILRGEFQQCGGFIPSADSDPARFSPVAEIQMLTESGGPAVVDLTEVIELDTLLDRVEAPNDPTRSQLPPAIDPTLTGNTGTFSSTSGAIQGGTCACTTVNTRNHVPPPLALLALAGLGFVTLARRR